MGLSATTWRRAAGDGVSDGAALRGRAVTMRFGGVRALEGVDVSLRRGTVHGLIGPNGAGKSTLLDCLGGQQLPSRGTVELAGQDVTRRSATWRARHGMRRTFQRQQLYGWLSVQDNLLVALEWHGGGGGSCGDLVALPSRRRLERERRDRVDAMLERFGIADLRSEPAGTLPIGRARMVEFARALIDRPSVLLLDEPTSGLDAHETAVLGEAVDRAAADDGCAVLLVEHDVPFVLERSAEVTVLHLGQVIAQGSPETVRAAPAVRDAYLGSDPEEHR